MAVSESALSELGEFLAANDGSLATSLAEILTVAVQELIEADAALNALDVIHRSRRVAA